MSHSFSVELFERVPVVGILRGLPEQQLCPVVEAFRIGGLTNLEITMNTRGAADQIRAARGVGRNALNIGAGTVTSPAALEEALAAGAAFIVTPTVSVEVIERCVHLKVPVFPGALSPTEILRSWELGATVVKVFPADRFGPEYVHAMKATFPRVRLMPTGGVDVDTLGAYAKAGADAFGVGTPLFRPERLAAGDWEWVRNQCRAFCRAYQLARTTV